jgi:hypothetical protein
MTKEERIAARKKTMADIVAKRDATIAREKNKSSSAKEKRAKRNTDFSAKVKEVNRTRKAKQKAKDEKRIAARKKVVNKINKGVDATIARGKKQRADNIAKRKASYAKFTSNPKANKSTTTTKSKSATRAVDRGGRLSARGSEGFKPTDTRRGPSMDKVNKEGEKGGGGYARPKRKGPSGPSMTSMGGAKLKPRNKDKKVKPRRPSGPSMTGFRKGGSIDGCAKRGLTRAKGSS